MNIKIGLVAGMRFKGVLRIHRFLFKLEIYKENLFNKNF